MERAEAERLVKLHTGAIFPNGPRGRRALRKVFAAARAGDRHAADAVLAVAVHQTNSDFTRLCLEIGHLPEDPTRRAVFLLRNGQVDAYRAADPDGSLLAAAYQDAQGLERNWLRRSILATGLVDLARLIVTAPREKKLDRQDIARLRENGDTDELRRLIPELPVRRALELIDLLPAEVRARDPVLRALHAAAGVSPFVKEQMRLPLPAGFHVTGRVPGGFAPQDGIHDGHTTDGGEFLVVDGSIVPLDDLSDPDALPGWWPHPDRPRTVWTPTGTAAVAHGRLLLRDRDGTLRRNVPLDCSGLALATLASDPVTGRLAIGGDRLVVLDPDGRPLATVTDPSLTADVRYVGFSTPNRLVTFADRTENLVSWSLADDGLTSIACAGGAYDEVTVLPGHGVVFVGSDYPGHRAHWLDAERLHLEYPRIPVLEGPSRAGPRVSADGRWAVRREAPRTADPTAFLGTHELVCYPLHPLTELLDRPPSALTPADLNRVTAARRERDANTESQRLMLDALAAVLESRFGTEVALGDGSTTGPDDVALSGTSG